MRFTYYGHSTFSLAWDAVSLLFDPFITENPLAAGVAVSGIRCNYLFISHGHHDHIADAVAIARNTGAKVISNFEIVAWMRRQGVSNTHPMNTGGHWHFDFGKVKCVNAVHSSSFPDGSYAGSPMGFLVETGEGNFYYAGDTALTVDMKLIGEFKQIRFALLPIGGNFTMGVDNAIIASDYIRCERIIGLHFDTTDLIRIDHKEARDKFSRAGKELILPEIGQSIEL
jgi:L-ascorbate metabolism protein UlaG (beta-lactamase superfamily)